MPRRFTREEEDAIRTALLGAGRRIMGARGVRKTSIDELVREAGISKGSFYRFFPGKEALALDVLAGWEREFHQGIHDLFRTAEPRGVDETAAVLSAVFLEEFPRRVGESAYLARAEAAGAGADRRRTMDEQDLRFFAELKPLLHAAGLAISAEDAVVMAGLRLLFDAALGILAAPSDRSGSPLEGDHFRAAFTLPATEETLREISFTLRGGEVYGFLGPSGAGKSTTQMILYRMLTGYSGEISLFGTDLTRWDTSFLERIGIVFETPNLYVKLTGRENLAFALALRGRSGAEETSFIDIAAERLGLTDAPLLYPGDPPQPTPPLPG